MCVCVWGGGAVLKLVSGLCLSCSTSFTSAVYMVTTEEFTLVIAFLLLDGVHTFVQARDRQLSSTRSRV